MTEMVAMAAPSRDRTKTTTPHAWKGHIARWVNYISKSCCMSMCAFTLTPDDPRRTSSWVPPLAPAPPAPASASPKR